MVNYKKCEKGSALFLNLFILFILLTFSFAMTAMTSTEIRIAGNNVEATQAFYLAEAGIAEAINLIYSNPNVSGTIIDKMPMGNGLVTVTGSWSGNVVTLEAVGKVGEIKQTVKQSLQVIVSDSIFDHAIITFADSYGSTCKLFDDVNITGDGIIGTELEIDNNVIVKGNLYTKEKPVKNNSSVQVIVVDDLDFPPFPQIPEWQKPNNLGQPCEYNNVNSAEDFKTGNQYYVAKRVNLRDSLELDNVYIECSSLNLRGEKYSGITFVVDGPIDIESNNTSFENVSLIAKGSITVEGKTTVLKNMLINTAGDFKVNEKDKADYHDIQIFAQGNVFCTNSINVKSGILMSSRNIYLANNFELEGHILAKGKLTAKNHVKIIGSMGFGEATLENKVVLIYSKNTGAPIPNTVPKGIEITKLMWSEG